MSGPAAAVVGKVFASAIASKAVGKITGNDKLGMLAGLAVGIGNPLGFGASATETAAGTVADGATAAATTPAATTVGDNLVNKTTGLLSKVSNWAEKNPGSAKLAGGIAGGAVQAGYGAYSQNKMMKELNARDRRDYERTHQMPTYEVDSTGSSGMLRSKPEEYYARYKNMYRSGDGVR